MVDPSIIRRDISINPRMINYGICDIHDTTSTQVVVMNISNHSVKIKPVGSLEPPFFITDDNVSDAFLLPSKIASFRVLFRPDFAGKYQTSLSISSTNPYTPAIKVFIEGDGSDPDVSDIQTGSRYKHIPLTEMREYIE